MAKTTAINTEIIPNTVITLDAITPIGGMNKDAVVKNAPNRNKT